MIIGGTHSLRELTYAELTLFTFKVFNIDLVSSVCQYDLCRRFVISDYSEKKILNEYKILTLQSWRVFFNVHQSLCFSYTFKGTAQIDRILSQYGLRIDGTALGLLYHSIQAGVCLKITGKVKLGHTISIFLWWAVICFISFTSIAFSMKTIYFSRFLSLSAPGLKWYLTFSLARLVNQTGDCQG